MAAASPVVENNAVFVGPFALLQGVPAVTPVQLVSVVSHVPDPPPVHVPVAAEAVMAAKAMAAIVAE